MIRFLLLLLALLGPVAAHAQRQKATAAQPEVPALWVVREGRSTAYLFGTVHTLPRGVDWFKPHVARALDGSKRLVLETEIPESGGLDPVLMRLARLPAERPLADRVPDAWRPTLARATQRLKPPPLDWYKTWFVALTFTNLQAAADGMDPRIGVEAVLSERAHMRNIPVTPLETVEQQLIFFDSLSEADQQQVLLAALEGLDTSKSEMSLLIGDWLLGNSDSLATRVNSSFERSPMLRRLLVEDRNQRWADWLAKQMKSEDGPIFVAVGAGHLAGKGSLVEELERRGLNVKRVMPEPPPKKRRR